MNNFDFSFFMTSCANQELFIISKARNNVHRALVDIEKLQNTNCRATVWRHQKSRWRTTWIQRLNCYHEGSIFGYIWFYLTEKWVEIRGILNSFRVWSSFSNHYSWFHINLPRPCCEVGCEIPKYVAKFATTLPISQSTCEVQILVPNLLATELQNFDQTRSLRILTELENCTTICNQLYNVNYFGGGGFVWHRIVAVWQVYS